MTTLLKTQVQVLTSFILRSGAFVLLPHESGKLLCYASLPYLFDGLQQSAGGMDTH